MHRIKMFADSADIEHIRSFSTNPMVAGYTTNPTLMRKAGVTDYEKFGREAAELVAPFPISLEVLSDDFYEMGRQARKLFSFGPNVYVKIPVTNTSGDSAHELIEDLAKDGIKQNVTAIFTVAQVAEVARALAGGPESIISVFAGRVADAGVDPVPIMAASRAVIDDVAPAAELLWASPRELLNIVQAEQTKCDIITMTGDLWAKYSNVGKDLDIFSRETVEMFYRDAVAAGFEL